jgi:hypothetical protein
MVALAIGTLSLSPNLASVARAQDGADKAAAEALFGQGKKAFEAEDYAEACKKFDASNKLDPAVGTLLFLGECNERQGKTASAWASFKQAASLAERTDDDKRKSIAEVRIAALEPQVSKLSVVVTDPADGLSIRRDGVALPQGSWGAALPVDAGKLRIDATAPGKKPWSTTLDVQDGGETFTVNVPTLEDVGGTGPTATPTPAPPAPATTVGADQGADDGSSNLGTALEITGLSLAGLGGVGLVVGSVFGVLAKSSNDDSLDACRTETLCTQEGLDLRDEAKSRALGSTVSFILGGVLVAGGLTLFFLAPDDEEGSSEMGHLGLDASLGPGHGGLTLHGSW